MLSSVLTLTNTDLKMAAGAMDTVGTPAITGIFLRHIMLTGILDPGHQRVSFTGIMGIAYETRVDGDRICVVTFRFVIVAVAYGKAVTANAYNFVDISLPGQVAVHRPPPRDHL